MLLAHGLFRLYLSQIHHKLIYIIFIYTRALVGTQQ